ncbi:major facilitator superfamily MFS_1 [Allomuricauda ruestringensis DSM 13258]|uniref:Major facilitator superfamily MFS_1 n=1 Tax=Allomuricauda ruestringensis (strain DSM 13258 / CIP 107369 / LMG 19739 / B1) TaxID=886377 RepID=G2PMZ7_ALLRU|nr:MFS transporter [Allomuricauda ruestringensis]AEM72345.1 major facilitator superfamily MFS_1 [Allomuricauda ruestringensis DSM 13258]
METSKPTTKRYIHIIGLVMIVFFVISFITNILNSIIVDVKDSFDLSLTLTGLLPFTFFIAYGIMSIPAGFLSEKYSERTLLSVSFLVMALASLGFALFPQYGVFSITLFVLGCCMAVLQVIINPMLRVAGGEEHFAFNSVLAQLVFGAASFLSPYLYKYLVSKDNRRDTLAEMLRGWVPQDLPWASLYIVFAVICLVLFFYVFLTRYPKFEKTEEEKAGDTSSYWDLIKNKWTILYFLGIFCYVGTEQGVGNWISQFLSQYHGLDPQTVGANTVSYFWAMLTVGCLLGLLLLKFMDSRKLLILATSITIVSLVLALTGSAQMALIGFPMVGFFISVMYSIIFSLALNSVKEHHGSLSGILCTGIAGGAVIPFIVGGLGELMSLKSGMFFLIIPLIFILSIGFWAKPLVNNKTISLKKD